MSRVIVKIEDYYLDWSSIVDSPVTFGMKFGDWMQYYKTEYGEISMTNFTHRMKRVEEHGTSYLVGGLTSAEDFVQNNRAGPDEDCLTYDEIYKAYCLQEPIRDGWTVPTAEDT